MLQARLEQRQTLLVSVLEARGLAPRKGVVVAFQASQLPNPLVEVGAPGHAQHRVDAAHTLKPVFPDVPPGRFAALAPDAVITVRLLDRKAGSRDAVLGTASFAAAHVGAKRGDQGLGSENPLNARQGGGRRVGEYGSADEGPVYVWLPLSAPRAALGWRARRAGSVVLAEGNGVPELQARMHVSGLPVPYFRACMNLRGAGGGRRRDRAAGACMFQGCCYILSSLHEFAWCWRRASACPRCRRVHVSGLLSHTFELA